MTEMPDADTYALKTVEVPEVAAPDVAWQPPMPRAWRPKIGLIGAGGIAGAHLDAYRTAGWEVAWICNRSEERAKARAAEFYPAAQVTTDAARVLADPEVEVVDITPHPVERAPLIEAALTAGKHVLSQKPFVLDLDLGERLCDLADARGLRLAVNQNGRWAPHFAFMREAVRAGHVGQVISAHVAVHWNHGWIAGTPFEKIEPLILYDFGIHWFDFVASVTNGRAETVFATAARAPGQTAKVPLLSQALIRLKGGGQASLVFDGGAPFGPRDTTYVAGTGGSLTSEGPDLGQQQVTMTTAAGRARPALTGAWFNDGFRGAMGELLSAVEDGREPINGGRENLGSLATAFAAIASARDRREVAVGSVRAIIV